jgi:hypothetical protein
MGCLARREGATAAAATTVLHLRNAAAAHTIFSINQSWRKEEQASEVDSAEALATVVVVVEEAVTVVVVAAVVEDVMLRRRNGCRSLNSAVSSRMVKSNLLNRSIFILFQSRSIRSLILSSGLHSRMR